MGGGRRPCRPVYYASGRGHSPSWMRILTLLEKLGMSNMQRTSVIVSAAVFRDCSFLPPRLSQMHASAIRVRHPRAMFTCVRVLRPSNVFGILRDHWLFVYIWKWSSAHALGGVSGVASFITTDEHTIKPRLLFSHSGLVSWGLPFLHLNWTCKVFLKLNLRPCNTNAMDYVLFRIYCNSVNQIPR